MKKYVKKESNNQFPKKVQKKKYMINKPLQDKNLIKEIEKSKREIAKNSVPLHYIKVDEKITTTVFKIPFSVGLLREPNSNIMKENKNNIFHKKNNIMNTINTDKLNINKKNNIFPFKPFSSNEMGYKYYKQKLNTFYPRESESKNCFCLKKDLYPSTQSSGFFKRIRSCENYNNYNYIINDENITIKNKYKSPETTHRNKHINSPFYQRYLNNSGILQGQNKLNNNSRIKHRIININRSIDYINNNSNNYYDYNNDIKNNNNNIIYSDSNDSNIYNRTIVNNKSLHNIRRIYLDNNYKNNKIYSLNNSHIFHSPQIIKNKNMYFIEDKTIENPNLISNHKQINGGKIKNLIEKKQSNDGEYIIETIFSKKIYDKQRINNKIDENDKKNINSSRRDYGDNYQYYERNEVTTLSNGKIKHIRRSPVHVYGFENYILKNNKKIIVKSPPIKGKLIRIYRNNNKKCKVCNRNERKKKEFGSFNSNNDNNIVLPVEFKKGEFNYSITEY